VAEKMTTDKKISGGPKIGRREFVKSSTAAVAVATIGPVTLLSSHTANAAESEGFSNAYFSQRAGEFFQVDAGAGGWNSLELMEVVSSNTSPLLDQFTLRFRGAPSLAIDEGVYDVAPPSPTVMFLRSTYSLRTATTMAPTTAPRSPSSRQFPFPSRMSHSAC